MKNIKNNPTNQTEYIKKLEATCKSQETQIKILENQITWLMEQMKLSKHKNFGTSSEKSEYDQLGLFNEAEKEADDSIAEPKIEEIKYKRKKKAGKKKEMLENLPVEEIEYFLSEEEQACKECGTTMHIMGKDIREELVIEPPKMKVIKHIRYVYACRNCENNSDKTPIVKAKLPEPVIVGSIASPSLVSYIMYQKYTNAIPLYRLEKDFKNLDIEISRQTMSNWIIRSANDWLKPLYFAMRKELINREVLHADETVLQVLKEPNKKPQSKSYMWLYRTSGDTEKPIVLFEYQPDRAGKRPKEFLEGFKGYLHTDGYQVYHNLLDDIIVCGCFAHVRRKFNEALKSLKPSEQIGSESLTGKGYCNKLFKIEREIKDYTFEEKYKARQKLAKPILEDFLAWLKKSNALPKSALGKAVNYALNQWEYLENYILDGRCEIDNNRAERSIKNFVIGRKNFLFSDTVRGAEASSIIYSIIETAKENGLKPMNYLKYLFENIPNMDLESNPDLYEILFPWGTLPEECYRKNNN